MTKTNMGDKDSRGSGNAILSNNNYEINLLFMHSQGLVDSGLVILEVFLNTSNSPRGDLEDQLDLPKLNFKTIRYSAVLTRNTWGGSRGMHDMYMICIIFPKISTYSQSNLSLYIWIRVLKLLLIPSQLIIADIIFFKQEAMSLCLIWLFRWSQHHTARIATWHMTLLFLLLSSFPKAFAC